MTLNIPGYTLSTDYEKLWNLINKGYRIPAWVYNDEYYMWDIVEVTYLKKFHHYAIGSRGMLYEGVEDSIEEFIFICK